LLSAGKKNTKNVLIRSLSTKLSSYIVTEFNIETYNITEIWFFMKGGFIMDSFDFFRYFLILLVPGVIGAVAFSIAYRLRTEVNVFVALIIDLLTFIIMITGLYYFHGVVTVADLLFEFTCLSFTRNFALLSILISIVIGVIGGLIRRLFFWIRP